MKYRPLLIMAFLFGLFTVQPNQALACSCLPKPNVLDAYEQSDVVVIVRIVSVDKVPTKEGNDSPYVNGIRATTARIEQIYKGTLRVRDELIFRQGNGADCIVTFSEEDMGNQFLFYLQRPKSYHWVAFGCGRSNEVGEATEDLLYLNNVNKLRGKTRVSGEYGHWNPETFPTANKTILIRGETKTYETKTDSKGIFEIYDLPPGKYSFEPEMPKGWRISRTWSESADIEKKQISSKSVSFNLSAKKHVSISVSFEPDNAIEGRILDPSGNPLPDVCAYLWGPNDTEGFGPFNCTDNDGHFRIESVGAGSYVLVVNQFGASAKHNFPKSFYPGVTDRAKAALISIGDGEVVKGINMVVPELLETITLTGVLLYSDDTPVEKTSVEFEPTEKSIYHDERVETDVEGHFEFRLVKGAKGKLSSHFFAYLDQYENCPKLDALIKQSSENYAKIDTPSITIEADHDLNNLVLRFPFPACKRKQRDPR